MNALPPRIRQFDNCLASLERDTPAITLMRRNAAIIRSQLRDPEPDLGEPMGNHITKGMF